VVVAGLVAAVGGLVVAMVLRALIATTPARPSEYSLFWGTVLLGVSGLIAGLAVEAVRQLQSRSPDPEVRRGRQRQGRRRGPRQG
jgi:hypothetical protein